jgi:hypothetical protein
MYIYTYKHTYIHTYNPRAARTIQGVVHRRKTQQTVSTTTVAHTQSYPRRGGEESALLRFPQLEQNKGFFKGY